MYDADGRIGIHDTLKYICSMALEDDCKDILIFEDDLNIIREDINDLMPDIIDQLPADYDMLQLGANIPKPHYASRYSENLLRVQRSLGLHAVAYSRECVEKIVNLPKEYPIDCAIAEHIQKDGRSFVTYPLLVSQRPGYSDIEKRQVDYSVFIEERYKKVLEHLKLPA
jgi:hypothetical protein